MSAMIWYSRTGTDGRDRTGGPTAARGGRSTSPMMEPDLRAISVYLRQLPMAPPRSPAAGDPAMHAGAVTFIRNSRGSQAPAATLR